jgi:hypothetical protein
LLQSGWRVLAIDSEATAIVALFRAMPERDKERLEARVLEMADVFIPRADLVNASLSLPFLPPEKFAATWLRMRTAGRRGGRLSAILFCDRDEFATDPMMACRSPAAVLADLAGFNIERWDEREEDGRTALGEMHHYHVIELVAQRIDGGGEAADVHRR